MMETVCRTKPVIAKVAEPFLVQCPSEAMTTSNPLNEALFREFSETPQTQEGVSAFANKHGWLGLTKLMVSPAFPGDPESPQYPPVLLSERLSSWKSEIDAMYHLVRVWDPPVPGRRSDQLERFEQKIQWIHGEAIIYHRVSDYGEVHEVIASRDIRPGLFDSLRGVKDLKQITRCYLQLKVNEKLAEHQVDVRLLWDRRFSQLGLCMVPGSLIGLLWLQFAKAIEGSVAHRQCEDCGKWFALGGRAGRSDKKFCSATCRVRKRRLNQKLKA